MSQADNDLQALATERSSMSEIRYLVTEQYASGHEMSYDVHGPATREEHGQTLPDYIAEGFPTRRDALDMLFEEGDLNAGGSTFIVSKVRDWVVVVEWDEPEHGVAAYGPYTGLDEIDNVMPLIERDFMNDRVLPGDVVFNAQQLVTESRYGK